MSFRQWSLSSDESGAGVPHLVVRAQWDSSRAMSRRCGLRRPSGSFLRYKICQRFDCLSWWRPYPRCLPCDDGDIKVDFGSGQSHAERGKPANAWRGGTGKIFRESLPIAGVDGTLAHRMLKGPARGQAFLKTGSLSNTRALAGHVRAKSGKLYAVAVIVNHPKAAQAAPSLDAFIEWIAKNG